MMKFISFLLVLLLSTTSYCQEKISTTDSFTIEGKIKNPVTFSIRALDSLPSEKLGDTTTVNHLGEVKSNRKNVKGILLKKHFSKSEIRS